MPSLKRILKNIHSKVISWLLGDIQQTQGQILQAIQDLSAQVAEQLPESFTKTYVDHHLFSINHLADPQQRRLNKAVIRRLCQVAYVGEGVALCRVLGKYRLYVNAVEVGLAGHLMLNGFWELPLTEFIVRTVKPGMTAIDVGANFGYFTLLLADLCGHSGRVYSFEPNPQVHALLNKSVQANGYQSRVSLHQQAVTDREAFELNFYIPKDYSGRAALVDPEFVPPSTSAEFRFETVSSVQLDAALGKEAIVDFVKIDAEGSERAVWRGMRQLLNRSKNICVALEFSLERYDGAAVEFLDEILTMGFQLSYLDGEEVKPTTKEDLSAKTMNDSNAGHVMLILRRADSALQLSNSR